MGVCTKYIIDIIIKSIKYQIFRKLCSFISIINKVAYKITDNTELNLLLIII